MLCLLGDMGRRLVRLEAQLNPGTDLVRPLRMKTTLSVECHY